MKCTRECLQRFLAVEGFYSRCSTLWTWRPQSVFAEYAVCRSAGCISKSCNVLQTTSPKSTAIKLHISSRLAGTLAMRYLGISTSSSLHSHAQDSRTNRTGRMCDGVSASRRNINQQ
ncbi:UNVERIFIED_CONTAM: hypothetical protein HHA_269705 [Hammondia hammondi]|eukprot:XP_008882357.1 hypothetical protein HHA_269705 [Hammondia hammondi]